MKPKLKKKKVKLPAKHIIDVEVPVNTKPVIITGPKEHIVTIASIPKEEGWWEYLFGTKKA